MSSRSIKCAADAYNVRVLLLRISIITISTKTILTLSIARRNFRADTCVKRQVLKREKKFPPKVYHQGSLNFRMGIRSRHIIRGIWRNSEGIPSSEEKTLGQRKATKRPKSCCKTGSVNHILNSSSFV